MDFIENHIIRKNSSGQISAIVLTLVSSFLFISFGVLVRYCIDNMQEFSSYEGVIFFCSAFIGIRVMMPVCYALTERIVHEYCINAESVLRLKIHSMIDSSCAEDMESVNRSELFSVYETAMSSTSTYIRTIWGDALPVLFQTLFIVASVWWYLGTTIALEFLLVVVVYVSFVIKMTGKRFPLMRNVALSRKKVSGVLHGLGSVSLSSKIYGSGRRSEEKMRNVIRHYDKSQRSVRDEFFRFGFFTTLLSSSGSVIILITAGIAFTSGKITFGSLIMLATFLFQVFLPLNRIGVLWRNLNRSRIDFRVLSDALSPLRSHFTADLGGVGAAGETVPDKLSIILDNVSKNKDGKTVFSGLRGELVFHPGKPVLLVGENGAGKTSLVRLLSLVDRPDEGTITFVPDITTAHSGGITPPDISVVTQSFSLLNASLKENLAYFLGEFSETEFTALAQRLHFPYGPDFLAGEGGRNLSGGELQKLNIITALMKKSHLLIMDEPTSALDHDSVSAITELIRQYLLTGHVLIVSHDPGLQAAFPDACLHEVKKEALFHLTISKQKAG
ncbi:ATP-binding cassette domain-containing protein [Erwinia sp. V71]|uniref:ATP-binding cassette domain-containing protein n=1 Tax=Erwinia sp. V71 TaxID=3369424 RepID=UPI003F639663